MNGDHKLTASHRERKAVVYLRQSSEGQVKHNKESQALQYSLLERARSLGFRSVEMIDCDLGSSASLGAKKRVGFERLLAMVALGEVGLIMSREVSRLARTDKDWCQLFELCQLFGTHIGDAEQIYDLSSMDDQLVLGIKGTLSVVELKILQARMVQGQENKARRGELYRLLPPGYVLDGAGKPAKDPDLRIQQAIELVFARFRDCWSARQTFKSLRDEAIQLPVNKWRGGKVAIVFQLPTHSFVRDVIKNPFYAGVYFYGRRPMELVVKEGAVVKKRQGRQRNPEHTRVFIRDHHEGYIDWATFEENRKMLRRNNLRGEADVAVGAVRAGYGLLAGLLRCRRCGRKLQVRYWGKSGTAARYLCTGTFDAGGEYCQGFGGATADNRFAEEVLRVISPLGVRASLEAIEQAGSRQDGTRTALQQQVQQLEYEALRAGEQFNAIDARNRLVAGELERRWNAKLEELAGARKALEECTRQSPALSDEEIVRLQDLGRCFAEVWNGPACPMLLKKKIVRTVVEEVVVDQDSPGTLRFVVHWKGGAHTSFEMAKPAVGEAGKTGAEAIDIVRQMAVRYGDDAIARVLTRSGLRTGKGNRWSAQRVHTVRRKYGIEAPPADPAAAAAVVSLNEAARICGVSDTTIARLVKSGLLPMKQVVPWAPWEIRRSDLMSDRVSSVLDRLKRTGKLVLGGDTADKQKQLFP